MGLAQNDGVRCRAVVGADRVLHEYLSEGCKRMVAAALDISFSTARVLDLSILVNTSRLGWCC